jgi:aminomethyltransferase
MTKQTPLYQTHIEAGAKMVEFGGWLMPVQYTGIIEEHHAVRQRAGLFDVSHMGEFLLKGKDAAAFLQKIATNDISRLQPGQVQYSPVCYAHGGTVDDLLIYKYADDDYMLVVNAGNTGKDWQWLNDNKAGFCLDMTDVSDSTALLALQGPRSAKILGRLSAEPLEKLLYYRFLPQTQIAGCPVLLSRTGYTGEDGFEIYCRPENAAHIWQALLSEGQPEGVLPAGLGARDTLRFEACLPLYGHELAEDITPLEAGLGLFVKPDKGDFNGRTALAAQKQAGVPRKLAGVEMIGRGVARADYPVWSSGRIIGKVTTGSFAPTLGKNLALALVEKDVAEIGRTVEVEIRGKKIEARVVAKPFYKKPAV